MWVNRWLLCVIELDTDDAMKMQRVRCVQVKLEKMQGGSGEGKGEDGVRLDEFAREAASSVQRLLDACADDAT